MITDNIPGLVSYVDAEGCYRFVNKKYEEWFGLSRKEIIGKQDKDILPAEYAETFWKHDQEVIAKKGPISFEEVVPEDDGMHTYISVKFPL